MACSEILVFGHSFVKRLDRAIYQKQHNSFNNDFGLQQCTVKVQGYSGLSVFVNQERLHSVIENTFRNKYFDGVVIQLGSNDIGQATPESVTSSLIELAHNLLDQYAVKFVYICQLFTRPNPRAINPEEYEYCRLHINDTLKKELHGNSRIKFWPHRRIFHSPHQIFAADGVHLNLTGTVKLYKSFRQAIIFLVEDILNLNAS